MSFNTWKYLLSFWLLGATSGSYGQAAVAPAASSGSAHKICWQEGRLLTLADFRAKNFPKSAPFNPNSMGALSATSSYFTPVITASNAHVYLVYAIFIPDSSWVNTKRVRTAAERAETLAHEQIHFDLSELTARKLRQRIAQGIEAGEDLDGPYVSQDIARIQQEEKSLNDEFDQETVHTGGRGREAPVHKRWQQRIRRELAARAAYKSTAATCP